VIAWIFVALDRKTASGDPAGGSPEAERLEQSRLGEREDPLGDDQMVEQLHVDEVECGLQPACDRDIGLTRLGGSGWLW
jgi:hypothetical protein